jgi:hypothetical protein
MSTESLHTVDYKPLFRSVLALRKSTKEAWLFSEPVPVSACFGSSKNQKILEDSKAFAGGKWTQYPSQPGVLQRFIVH